MNCARAQRLSCGWTLQGLRRAIGAGWAPLWLVWSHWPPDSALAKRLENRFLAGAWPSHRAARMRLSRGEVAALAPRVDRIIAIRGHHAPAWLEEEYAGSMSAPPAGEGDRPDRTRRGKRSEPPADAGPASREGGEAKAGNPPGSSAPRAGDRMAKPGEAGAEGAGQCSLTAAQKARGGAEADPQGATLTADTHTGEQESATRASPATAPRDEGDRRETVDALRWGAQAVPHRNGDNAAAANDVAGTSDGAPLQASTSHGGVCARWDCLPGITAEDRRDARRLELALVRWLQHLDAGTAGNPTPRIDGRRLVREIVTRRNALSRARRWEREPGVVLVLVDVSGSCAVAAPSTMLAAKAFTEAFPSRVAVVVHSNGCVTEMHGVAAAWHPAPARQDGMQAMMATRLTHQGGVTLAGVLVLGDDHAGDIYQELAQRAPLIWLDDYMANSGPRPAGRTLAAIWRAPKRPVVWMQGVRTAHAATDALQQAIRVS